MMLSAIGGRRQLVGRVAYLVGIAGLVWVLALTGCGSDMIGGGEGDGTKPAEDECLFVGEDNPDKAHRPAVMSKDGTEKANLRPDGNWRPDSVAEGSWERHRINTKKDYTYTVELCTRAPGSQDDPDLHISRDEDPFNNYWKRSAFGDPVPEVIVFRAKKDGRMYVGVYGFDSIDDATVDYYIRVRKRKNPARG